MSKSVVVIVVIVVISIISAGGTYLFLQQDLALVAPPAVKRVEPLTPTQPSSRPDHGIFEKRFQPAMPPVTDSEK